MQIQINNELYNVNGYALKLIPYNEVNKNVSNVFFLGKNHTQGAVSLHNDPLVYMFSTNNHVNAYIVRVQSVHLSANRKPLFSDFIFVKKYSSDFLIALTTYAFLVHKKSLGIVFLILKFVYTAL